MLREDGVLAYGVHALSWFAALRNVFVLLWFSLPRDFEALQNPLVFKWAHKGFFFVAKYRIHMDPKSWNCILNAEENKVHEDPLFVLIVCVSVISFFVCFQVWMPSCIMWGTMWWIIMLSPSCCQYRARPTACTSPGTPSTRYTNSSSSELQLPDISCNYLRIEFSQ